MENTFTPGPLDEHNGQIYAENDKNGRTLAIIPYYEKTPEQDANARLIASALELMDALEYLQTMPNDPRAHRAALDAIAKAKG